MGWKFWQRDKEKTDGTIIDVVEAKPAQTRRIYVSAQTSDKAYKLYKKLKKEKDKK